MKRSSGTARNYPRTARLNQLVQEIVAEEIERIDDERLGFFTVVGVEVEPDMRRAVVWYTTLDEGEAEDDGEELADALEQHRSRLQSAIGRQARTKRTPELSFRPDTVIRQAERVEQILRDIGDDGTATADGENGAEGTRAEPAPGPSGDGG